MEETNQTKFMIEKVTKKNCSKPYINWKGYDNSFNSWINKKHIVIQNELYSGTIYYATKFDLKIATDVNTSKLAEKADLASLKSDIINKFDIDRLEITHIDLSELSNVTEKGC